MPAREMPHDFLQRAAGMSIMAVRREWGCHDRLAHRWFEQAGIKPAFYVRQDGIGKRLDPPPADFAERALTMHDASLERHYDRGNKTIKRWHRESGTRSLSYIGGVVSPARPKSTRPKLVKTYQAYTSEAPRDGSREGLAAEHLRRFYPNVYRCEQGGAFALKGKFWRAGNAVLTPDELIAKAVRYGFDPDYWQRVAA